MEIIQIVIDIVLAIALAAFVYFSFAANPAEGYHKGVRAGFIVASLAAFGLLIGALSAVIVPPGSVGVVTFFGSVQSETLPPGIHFRLPFANVVHVVDTRVQPHNFQKIDAATQENLSVSITGTMNYHIDGAFASVLYQNVGDDFASKIIDPAFSDYLKQITPNYSADSGSPNFILAKRDEIRQLTKDQLNANLARYHIIVDDIYIVDIGYPAEYDAAITQKQVAQQQVQTEQQVLAQKQIIAQQAVVEAQGKANANVATAEGQAKANKLLSDSLTTSLIEYTYITKLAPTITTILLPSGSPFILDPNAFKPQ